MKQYEKNVVDFVDAAERSARKRKIRTAAILVGFVVALVAVWAICYSQGFEPAGLIKSRYPWLGWR